MALGKKLIITTIFVLFSSGILLANKSVFIISQHNSPSIAQAYKIDSSQVILQGYVDVSSYNQGYGAVGCATWPEKELIFFTYEDSGTIVWSSTKTLQKVGEYATPISSCSGIVVDREKELIYILWRQYFYSDNLYVYSYDSLNNTLVFQNSFQLKDSYENVIIGLGLSLDEPNNLLYASTNFNTIYVYNTNDFSLHHQISLPRYAVGIAVDPNRGYLYTGHWQSHNYLVRTMTSSPYTSAEVSIGLPVLGIDVDKETGYVYCTTYQPDFRVYNSSLQLLDTETNGGIGGPAGVAVGGVYKPQLFSITKDNNDVQGNCVRTDDLVTFKIIWSANGHNDTNVKIIDYLPPDLDYVSSNPNITDYNSTTKKYIWNLDTLSGSEYGTFKITARVKTLSCPCGRLTNKAVMEGDNYYKEDTADVNACSWLTSGIVYVDNDATSGLQIGTNWENAYIDLQQALSIARDCKGSKAVWVAEGTYNPTEDPLKTEVSFELINGVDLFGHFAGFETNPEQRDFANSSNETILDGFLDEQNNIRVNNVIRGQTVNASIDGLTIQSAGGDGVYLYDCDVNVQDCKIVDNYGCGILVYDSDLSVNRCIISENIYGISFSSVESHHVLTIKNSILTPQRK